ncbi:hypothetical protein BR93DRAFT_942496 [Coniochaeta sp. PMI_546]|nr:hypothetical protein BR93DRAFT_942496 [Coniochaeta sp. PMI_546]
MSPRGRRERNSNGDPGSQGPSDISSDFPESGYTLFDTTFSTYRVSPLHLGVKPLDQERLGALAKRLRDLLVGDVVRGVEVGLASDGGVMGRAGALEAVHLSWSSLGSVLGIGRETMDGVDGDGGRPVSRDLGSEIGAAYPVWDGGAATRRLRSVSNRQALHISIRYEGAYCTALLIPMLDEEEDIGLGDDLVRGVDGTDFFQLATPDGSGRTKPVNPGHFRNLPLLLFRMPTPLRSVVIDFLSNTFDCRISPLRLGTQTLLANLERWITISKLMSGSAASKDVVITLGFALPSQVTPQSDFNGPRNADLGLKSIDVIISSSDLVRFCDEGTKRKPPDAAGKSKPESTRAEHTVKRRKVDRDVLEEDWDWRYKPRLDTNSPDSIATPYPFTEALGTYFDEHLALNLFDSRTRITKVACAGFVLSEARLKLFSPLEKLGDAAGRPVLAPHIQAVIDCLDGLLERATARS